MFDWFYTQNGEQQGPVTETELRQLAASGQLQPSDLVWHQQLPEWIPLGSWLSRSERTGPMPPPTPWSTPKRGSKVWLIGAALVLLLVAGGAAFFLLRKDNGTGTDDGKKKADNTTARSFDLAPRNSKSYSVKLEKGKWVKIKAKAKNLGRFRFFVFDQNGKRIDARESQDGECQIDFVPDRTQPFRLQVTALGAPVRGDLNWTFHAPADLTANAKRSPATINGMLRSTDPIFLMEQRLIAFSREQPRYMKVHEFRFEADKLYTIDLESNWDPYLYIRSLAGYTLDKDDDGGNNLNARLRFRPAVSGVYRLLVTSFKDKNIGPYTLRITAQ